MWEPAPSSPTSWNSMSFTTEPESPSNPESPECGRSAAEATSQTCNAIKPDVRDHSGSAIVYSITETALLNGLKPYLYLTYILDQLRRIGPFPKAEELDRLLPWSKELPEELRTNR